MQPRGSGLQTGGAQPGQRHHRPEALLPRGPLTAGSCLAGSEVSRAGAHPGSCSPGDRPAEGPVYGQRPVSPLPALPRHRCVSQSPTPCPPHVVRPLLGDLAACWGMLTRAQVCLGCVTPEEVFCFAAWGCRRDRPAVSSSPYAAALCTSCAGLPACPRCRRHAECRPLRRPRLRALPTWPCTGSPVWWTPSSCGSLSQGD